MSSNPLSDAAPKAVWRFFYEISQIPRCSGNEKGIRNYLIAFAEERNLSWKSDDVGNIVIKKQATKGLESLPGAVLQGHMDMVGEKNSGVTHNFDTDPIRLVRDGDWLKADGTTLGADNGIAVAMALAVLDDTSIQHGPVEALFTVDEEVGLNGALGLDPSMIDGTLLLNLDTEELGAFYIGCAGGMNTEGSVPLRFEKAEQQSSFYHLQVNGLRGGHSGAEIHLGFANAIVILGRVLQALSTKADIQLVSIEGGSKHNAIPRDAQAHLSMPKEKADEGKKAFDAISRDIVAEIQDIEPNLSITLEEDEAAETVMDRQSTTRSIHLLRIMPHGVFGMSRSIEGMVETSSNFAILSTETDGEQARLKVLCSQRSSRMSALDDIGSRIIAVFESLEGSSKQLSRYPAWTPNPDSALLKTCLKVYKESTGVDAEQTAIHAGLECGVIGDKIEGMEMISFGPDLRAVHTPEERLNISSVETLWSFLLDLLRSL